MNLIAEVEDKLLARKGLDAKAKSHTYKFACKQINGVL